MPTRRQPFDRMAQRFDLAPQRIELARAGELALIGVRVARDEVARDRCRDIPKDGEAVGGEQEAEQPPLTSRTGTSSETGRTEAR